MNFKVFILIVTILSINIQVNFAKGKDFDYRNIKVYLLVAFFIQQFTSIFMIRIMNDYIYETGLFFTFYIIAAYTIGLLLDRFLSINKTVGEKYERIAYAFLIPHFFLIFFNLSIRGLRAY